MRVKCLATMSPARSRTRTGDERTNHEATTPLTSSVKVHYFSLGIFLPKVKYYFDFSIDLR